MDSEKDTSSPARSSLWPLVLLGILTVVSWLTRQPKAVHPQDSTDNTSNSGRNDIASIAGIVPTPPENPKTKTTCRPDQTPWWKTLGEGIALFGGLALLIVNLYQMKATERAATAAETANINAQAALTVSEQANITIGRKDGVVAELTMPKSPNDEVGLVMYFQNSGHMPARFEWGIDRPDDTWLKPFRVRGLLDHMTRTRNRKTGQISQNGGVNTIGGDSLFVANIAQLPRQQVPHLADTPISGMFEYCDELGTYSCQKFILQLLREPYARFRIGLQSDCPIFNYANRPEPDIDYLPVCKTPTEREQERKDTDKLWVESQKKIEKMKRELEQKVK